MLWLISHERLPKWPLCTHPLKQLWNNYLYRQRIWILMVLFLILLILLTPNIDSSKSLKPWNFSNSMTSIHPFKSVSMISLFLQLILSLHKTSQFSLCCKHTQYTYCWTFLFLFFWDRASLCCPGLNGTVY